MADLNQFVEKMIELLNLERQAEINESKAFYQNSDNATLENKGVCLRKMVLFSQKTGLYGRTLVTLGKGNVEHSVKKFPLPAHCITTGDIVGLSYSSEDNNVAELSSGIVTRVSETSIVIAFEEAFDSQAIEEDRLMRITRLANDVTFKRMKRALETLQNTPSSYCSSHLISVLFGAMPLSEPLNLSSLQQRPDDLMQKQKDFFNGNLNESQQDAVRFALSSRHVGVVHGPPGTGKTTTIVEVIVQAVKNFGWKILACAPSNIAVDNILERLIKYKIKAVRLGHPARLMEKIHSHSLAAILDSSHDTAIVKDVRRDIDTAMRNLQGSRNSGERSRLRTELKTLRKELREREEKALKHILHNAQVILSTNVSASDDGPLKHLPRDHFDLVVIDEAAQSLEAACWIPLLWAPRCILAGDHKQLPPTIMSRDAARRGLEQTLMERIIEMFGDKVVHMLTTQYRMNKAIMKWSSDRLYDGKLLADVSVAQHLLCHIPEVNDTELTSLPLLMIDTAGCDLYELRSQDEESKGNEGEADVVAAHVSGLVDSGVKQQDIGVITPYNLQVELLRSRLSTKYPALEIKSVDGFQGREKEAVVISMVRSNTKGEIGFLAENRRMNVAVTRARRHLTIVGDSTT
ncbi:DNA-binding protein SMUBP-2-like [Dendronephthya gigantea]|uniref:DNA-binding protein SMUBP-2-like n=1 Tax=Dendronephthya gigantea TaxID=151771 RepID=UPI00106A8D9B|nr:DNA-binding protein SMUBP-2-like [Dendronephthya gigantea]